MGSDMYMAAQSFRPRPKRFRWEGEEFVIQVDTFPGDYHEYWRGVIDSESTADLVKTVTGTSIIPSKPEVPARVWVTEEDAPAGLNQKLIEGWVMGWNDAVREFGIKPQKPAEQPWMTWADVESS